LSPPLGVLVPWSCRVGLSCRRKPAQTDLFRNLQMDSFGRRVALRRNCNAIAGEDRALA
jgi:hypothetical protein